jgi:hypothetical protein
MRHIEIGWGTAVRLPDGLLVTSAYMQGHPHGSRDAVEQLVDWGNSVMLPDGRIISHTCLRMLGAPA